jgi:ferric-dicitrate binding protein FerR (iron transport regulator)
MKKTTSHNIDQILKQIPKEIINIDTDQEWEQFHKKINAKKVRNFIPRYIYYISAAAAIVLIFFAYRFLTPLRQTFYSNTKSIEITLKDNTHIILFPNSKLTVSSGFNRSKRVVYLEGSGLFEVSHNPAKPFMVKTRNFVVQVKGTKFAVTSKQSKVQVIEGLVEIKTHKINKYLKAGQIALVDKNNIKIRGSESNTPILWEEKLIKFQASPLTEVAQTLSEYYNVEIVLADEIKQLKLTAAFKDQDLQTVLLVIAQTLDLKYKQLSPSKYLLYK